MRGKSCGTTLFPYPVFTTRILSSLWMRSDHMDSTWSDFPWNPNTSSTASLRQSSCLSLEVNLENFCCIFIRRSLHLSLSLVSGAFALPWIQACEKDSNPLNVNLPPYHGHSFSVWASLRWKWLGNSSLYPQNSMILPGLDFRGPIVWGRKRNRYNEFAAQLPPI